MRQEVGRLITLRIMAVAVLGLFGEKAPFASEALQMLFIVGLYVILEWSVKQRNR